MLRYTGADKSAATVIFGGAAAGDGRVLRNVILASSPIKAATGGPTIQARHGASLIHGPTVSTTSHRFNPTMRTAALQASTLTHSRLANSPMRDESFVNRMRGITANGNCMLRTTWL